MGGKICGDWRRHPVDNDMRQSNNRSLVQIETCFGRGQSFETKDSNTKGFSKIITDLPNRHDPTQVKAVFEKLFEVASTKIKDD